MFGVAPELTFVLQALLQASLTQRSIPMTSSLRIKRLGTRALLLLSAFAAAACGGTDARPTTPHPAVAGRMRFLVGATSESGTAIMYLSEPVAPTANMLAGTEYITSPRKAKITFTSVIFRDLAGAILGQSDLTSCVVTYDRSLPSGSTLLDCPFTVPVGKVQQISLSFDQKIEVLVSDAAAGIYSNSAVPSKYSTTAPPGGATLVPYTITISPGATRAIGIVFPSPLLVEEGSTPTLYVTTDMIHTFQMKVDEGGTTLSANSGNDPVALFASLTPGRSTYYANQTTIESIVVREVRAIRVFTDLAGVPLYVIGTTCGVDGPKGAWATPPVGATIGGWLGRDAAKVIAWALPTDTSYTRYSAYLLVPERTVIGQTTVLNCMATSSPPPPSDGKTYASGAPAMPNPTASYALRLLAK